jgi:hypothetical protein
VNHLAYDRFIFLPVLLIQTADELFQGALHLFEIVAIRPFATGVVLVTTRIMLVTTWVMFGITRVRPRRIGTRVMPLPMAMRINPIEGWLTSIGRPRQ